MKTVKQCTRCLSYLIDTDGICLLCDTERHGMTFHKTQGFEAEFNSYKDAYDFMAEFETALGYELKCTVWGSSPATLEVSCSPDEYDGMMGLYLRDRPEVEVEMVDFKPYVPPFECGLMPGSVVFRVWHEAHTQYNIEAVWEGLTGQHIKKSAKHLSWDTVNGGMQNLMLEIQATILEAPDIYFGGLNADEYFERGRMEWENRYYV